MEYRRAASIIAVLVAVCVLAVSIPGSPIDSTASTEQCSDVVFAVFRQGPATAAIHPELVVFDSGVVLASIEPATSEDDFCLFKVDPSALLELFPSAPGSGRRSQVYLTPDTSHIMLYAHVDGSELLLAAPDDVLLSGQSAESAGTYAEIYRSWLRGLLLSRQSAIPLREALPLCENVQEQVKRKVREKLDRMP